MAETGRGSPAKLATVALAEQRDAENYRREQVSIAENGDLRIDGYDVGVASQRFWGDDDYEYWEVVAAEWKDTMLLALLGERFPDMKSLRAWLDEKAIPHSFDSWI